MTDHVAYPGCYCADCVEGNPSARITGDKDRENPVEGAPYGEGLIVRITALEAENAEVRRAWAYAQGEHIRLMPERHELERQLKVARDALAAFLRTGPALIDRRGTDRYGRTLARLSVNGRDADQLLITRGLARGW